MSLPRIAILGCVGSLTLGLAACGNDRSTPTSPTPLQASPDLVVASPAVSNSGPAPDTPFTLSATVRNDGDGAAAATTLRYYQSTDATITTSDTAVGTDAVAGLAASGTVNASVDLTVPLTTGMYYYGACVDAVAGESDTTNNCSGSVVVTVADAEPQTSPDLTVGSPTVSESSPATGASFTLSATVRNDGDGAAAATTLRYYQSTDATITPSDTSMGTAAVAGLAATETSSASVALTAPSTAGTYYYGACADAVAEESDTTNNCSSSVTVTVEGPSFTLSGTVSDSRRTPGFVLPGAGVRLENGESTTTGPDGRYRLLNVSGAITVIATAPNYVTQTVEVMVDADRTLDFNLEHRETAEPPHKGVWTSPDILDSSDPTSLRSVMYAGRGMREFWDGRAQMWVTVNAYLFNVRYATQNIEFQVNPEFGSREAARAEVDTYAPALGRLPTVLLSGAREAEISAFHETGFGGNASKGIFHINTGAGEEFIRNGFLEEVFVHEGGHVSLDLAHANSPGWHAAQQDDGVFINNYARDYPDREDIAESILAYFIVKYRPGRVDRSIRDAILNAIPNRLAYFDGLGLDMSPYTATGSIVPGLGVSSVEPTRWHWRPFEGPPIR